MTDIFDKRIALDAQTESGWRSAKWLPAQTHLVDRVLPSSSALLTLVHISDTHICDAQSPARLPFSDRFADPHNPLAAVLGSPVGNYRSNEMLTTQVLKTMVDTINSLRGPVSGARPDVVVITGDLTDNAQENELDWTKKLLNGGLVTPNSGSETKFHGPGGEPLSKHYWSPDPRVTDDFPSTMYGMPKVPGLLEAAIDSFSSPGLEVPYIPVHGNHDLLLQGTVASDERLQNLAMAPMLPIDFNEKFSLEEAFSEFAPIGPAKWPDSAVMEFVPAPADLRRKFVQENDFSNAFKLNGRYSAVDVKGFLLISLDTVNENGGWDGSLSTSQFEWLEQTLTAHSADPIVILSHHPFDRMDNLFAKDGAEARVSGEQVVESLLRFSNVIAWLAGHEHRNRIERVGGDRGFWHIETCSLIDWPQQGRVIEVFHDADQGYRIVTTMFDHQAPSQMIEGGLPLAGFDLSNQHHLAAISRELAGNHWQRREGQHAVGIFEGEAKDRNAVL